MALTELITSVRSLIVSHSQGDDASFLRHVDAIIRGLTTQNRIQEAKQLKEAIKQLKGKKKRPKPASVAPLEVLSKQAAGLISFSAPKSPREVILTEHSEASLQDIVLEVRCAGKLAEAGLNPRNRLLFWGPPGCGKTAAASWLAQELDLPCGHVCLGSLITSFVGETGGNIAKVLRTAEETAMVLLIDEADAIAKSRDDTNDVGELRRVVNALLQGLDSFAARDSIVILASNHSEIFDDAVWRRFDSIVEFPMPTQQRRIKLLKNLTSGIKTRGSLIELAKKLSGLSYAEIERAVLDAARAMVIKNRKTISTEEIALAASEWTLRKKAASKLQSVNLNESRAASRRTSKTSNKSTKKG